METFNQSNNQTIELTYCWSPNDSKLLTNHAFMISRQVIRLIIYYVMPLIFVSVFYILIAKHLFQTKGVTLTPLSTQPLINEVTNTKRGQLTIRSTKQISNNTLSHNSNIQEQKQTQRPIERNNNNNYKKNLPSLSMTVDSEELMSTHESSPASMPIRSSPSPLAANLRRSRDLLYGTSTLNNNNMAIHTLYQDVKTRKQLRARHKVAKTVLFLCSVFFICWLPKQIHDLYW
jgi:hypothetical protein